MQYTQQYNDSGGMQLVKKLEKKYNSNQYPLCTTFNRQIDS